VDTDGESVVPYCLTAAKTGQPLQVHLVKPVGTGTAYAVLKNGAANGWEADLDNTDLVEVVFESLGATYTGVSGDFMNLRDSVSPSGYVMLRDASELADLIQIPGFDGSLHSFLSEHLYTDVAGENGTVRNGAQLPSAPSEHASFNSDLLGQGMMIPLYDDITNWEPSQITQRDMCVDMVDISLPLKADDLSRNQVEMDTEDDIADSGQNHHAALVVWRNAAPQTAVGLKASAGGQAALLGPDNTDAAGKTVAAGTPLTLLVTPEDGKAVASADLVLADGRRYSLVGAGEDVPVEEALLHAQRDEHGAYTFSFPACYQQATVEVAFADAVMDSYEAMIRQATQGDAQFVGNNGITRQNYRPSQEVTVHIRPYTGFIVDTIQVTGADGTDIPTTDVTAQALAYTPTYRVVSFVMPEQAVTVEVTYKDGYTVDLTTQNAGESASATYEYSGKALYNDAWLGDTLTLDEGDRITVKATCPSSMYVDQFLVTNIATSGAVLGEVDGNTLTFEMPASNVGVKVIFEEVTVGRYYASLNSDGDGTIRFVDGYPLNSVRHHYEAGDTVVLETVTDRSFEPIVNVKDINGQEIETTVLEDGRRSFVMPAANVTVSAQFAKQVEVRIISDTDSYGVLAFSDSTNTPTLTKAWSGDTVRFVEAALPLDERAVKILSITAEDSHGNAVEVVDEGNGSYAVKAGLDMIKIMADCDREQYLKVDPSIQDVFAVTQIDSGFPGDTVFFKQIRTDVTVSDLKVLDNAGREMAWKAGTVAGTYEVVLGYADATVYATVDNRQLVTYTLQSSDKYSYSLQGMMLDNGDGTGYALPGDELCLVIKNSSSYTASKYSETHWVKDAAGNELDLRYKSGGTTSYYYFTMPDGPVEVYACSRMNGGFYASKPLGTRFSSGLHWYLVTETETPTVVFVYTEDTTQPHLVLPETVTVDGVTYRVIGVDTTELMALRHLLSVKVNGETVTVRQTAPTDPPKTEAAPLPDSPKTGDAFVWGGGMMAALCAAVVTGSLRKRKNGRKT